MKNITTLIALTACVFLFACCNNYYHDLSAHITSKSSSDAAITSFSFHPDENNALEAEYSGNIFYDDGEILIIMPPGYKSNIDLNLKPRFSTKGLVYVNGSIQTSGANEHLFENDVVYEVVSANGANSKYYTVKIMEINSHIFVNSSVSQSGDGSSWEEAFSSIHEAANLASLFHESMLKEIWIAAGTYKPGDSDTDFFRLIPNTSYIGGFAGTESLITQRNISANKTIITGDLGNGARSVNLFTCKNSAAVNKIITFDGVYFESTQTAISAFLSSLARLRIFNCNFSNIDSTAVFSVNGRNTTITNSTFTNITARENFGAVHISGTDTELLDMSFNNITGNALSIVGAGIKISKTNFNNITGAQALFIDQIAESGTVNISDITIDTVTGGRGIYISSHSLILTKTEIENCDTAGFGGGIHLVNYGIAEITNTGIQNTNALLGEGIYYDGSASTSLLVKNVKYNGEQILNSNHPKMHFFGRNMSFEN